MENEIMNYEEVMTPDVEIAEMGSEGSAKNLGVALLIGAGAIGATVALVKLGKKAYTKIKAKKEQREAGENDFAEVTEEEDVTE